MEQKRAPRTETLAIRLTPAGLAAIRELAGKLDVPVSEMARLMIAHAAKNPPRVWKG